MRLLALTLIYTFIFLGRCADSQTKPQPKPEFIYLRIPGGTLETHGFKKSEVFNKSTGSFLGTTSSEIRVNATYRYQIALRGKFTLYIDETRNIALVIAPSFHPVVPVAIDSSTIVTKTSSGWARFNKHEHLQKLQRELSPRLESLAQSREYIELGRKEARITVEEFVCDWILKNRDSKPFVKVYFEDETEIPLPENMKLSTKL